MPSLALCVKGESVLTTMPGCTGQAHEATGFGARSTSTRHIRPTQSDPTSIAGAERLTVPSDHEFPQIGISK